VGPQSCKESVRKVGKVRQGKARHDKTRQDKAKECKNDNVMSTDILP
jgi:hypothetical protein